MTDRILSRQFHGTEGAEAWRVLPEGNVDESFWTLADPAGNEVDVATTSAPDQAE